MKGIGQLFLGLFSAVASSMLVLAATFLAVLESNVQVLPQVSSPTPLTTNAQPVFTPVEQIVEPAPFTATPECQYPPGWTAYTILSGDTLDSLAAESGISSEELFKMNCLDSSSLPAGSLLYLPPAATPTYTATATVAETTVPQPGILPTNTQISCGRPPGWIIYVVKSGNTLYRIALAYNISVYQLKFANCLQNDNIYTGQRLYVPNVTPHWLPTNTLRPTPTQPRPPTATATTPAPPPTATTVVPTTAVPTTAVPTVEATTEIPPTAEPPTAEAPTTAPVDLPTEPISTDSPTTNP